MSLFRDALGRKLSSLVVPPSQRPATVALLGDSISSPTFIGEGVGIYDATTNPNYAHAQGYWTWANIALDHRLRLVYTGGVAGNTTAQILARVEDVTGLAVLPGFCVVEAGINDILNDVAAATVIANLTGIYDALRAAGITVVACTAPPVWTDVDARRKRQEDINNWIRDYAATQPGMILCDWAGRWANAADGAAKTGFSQDGAHPVPAGAGALGKVLADSLRPHLSAGPLALASHNAEGSGTVNPMMLGTAGLFGAGLSGQLADGWLAGRLAGAGTLALSKVARTDGISGQWQQITVAGGGGYFVIYQDIASPAAPAVGEKWVAELEFEAADLAAVTRFTLHLQATGSTSPAAYSPFTGGVLPFPAAADVSAGVLRTPAIVIPAGLTALQIGLTIEATAGSVRVSRIRTRRVA